MTNNFFDVSQFSSNHGSMAKNFENSFQLTAAPGTVFGPQSANPSALGGALKSGAIPGGLMAASLNSSAVSAALGATAKQRPTSTQKSALMQAASSVNSSAAGKGAKKKGLVGGGAGLMRKSLNNAPTASSV